MGTDVTGSRTAGKKGYLACVLWCFIPVFGFFAFYLMADESGEDRYRSLGRIFAIFSLASFGVAVSSDLMIYVATRLGGTTVAAYVRSMVIVLVILIPVVYIAQIVKVMTLRSEYIRICGLKTSASAKECEQPDKAAEEAIDINNCSKSELMSLPGIDAALAVRILNDRQKNGGFASVDEFLDAYPIKPHFAARMEGMIFAGDSQRGTGIPIGARSVRAIDI